MAKGPWKQPSETRRTLRQLSCWLPFWCSGHACGHAPPLRMEILNPKHVHERKCSQRCTLRTPSWNRIRIHRCVRIMESSLIFFGILSFWQKRLWIHSSLEIQKMLERCRLDTRSWNRQIIQTGMASPFLQWVAVVPELIYSIIGSTASHGPMKLQGFWQHVFPNLWGPIL